MFKAHRRLFHSTVGSNVIRRREVDRGGSKGGLDARARTCSSSEHLSCKDHPTPSTLLPEGLLPASPGQNLVLTVLYVPYSQFRV